MLKVTGKTPKQYALRVAHILFQDELADKVFILPGTPTRKTDRQIVTPINEPRLNRLEGKIN